MYTLYRYGTCKKDIYSLIGYRGLVLVMDMERGYQGAKVGFEVVGLVWYLTNSADWCSMAGAVCPLGGLGTDCWEILGCTGARCRTRGRWVPRLAALGALGAHSKALVGRTFRCRE